MRPGSRNGYREVTVKTTAGPVALSRPKLRGTTEAFASRLFGSHVTKTNALESLVIASFVRGLSVRDVEATLADALGDQAAVSKSTVSAICQAIKDEYQAWARAPPGRGQAGLPVPGRQLLPDAPRLPGRAGAGRLGHHHQGKPAFIGLAPGHRRVRRRLERVPRRPERPGPGQPAADHLRRRARADHRDRAGLPRALRQRCLIHRRRNILAKIPAGMQAEVKDAYWAIFDTGDLKTPPGPRLRRSSTPGSARWPPGTGPTYPSAMKCLTTDRGGPDRLPTVPRRASSPHPPLQLHRAHLRRDPPPGQGHRPAPGETSCLTLVWAVLDRASAGWRGLTMTGEGLRLLQDLRRSLLKPPAQLRPRTVTTRQPGNHPETVRATA